MALLYQLRWDVEKVFDQLKNKSRPQKSRGKPGSRVVSSNPLKRVELRLEVFSVRSALSDPTRSGGRGENAGGGPEVLDVPVSPR